MQFGASIFYKYRRLIKWLSLFLVTAGPGIIVMVADNDAGGITTYAATGAKFGFNLIWFVILLGPIAFVVQEMCVRLGAVTKRGHAEAIFDAFGPFWGWFSLVDLAFLDFLTLISEYVGMTAALSVFGVPPIVTVVAVSALMMTLVLHGRYWTWEKIVLVFCGLNLIYIPAVFLLHPDFGAIQRSFIPSFPNGLTPDIFFFLMANIGTTIAPWMIFFHQSSVVDKGLTEKDIPFSRVDTAVGSFIVVLVATFIMILTGMLLYKPPNGINIDSAAQAAQAIIGSHPPVGAALAIGLFDAGLLGAMCISLASSWAMGEVFGWAHSINNKVTEAPTFYGFYFLDLLGAGIAVLIPGAPLVLITLFVQVIAVTLLPAALMFLILLLNQEELMGKYKNNWIHNLFGFSIVIFIVVLSTLYALSILFPGMI